MTTTVNYEIWQTPFREWPQTELPSEPHELVYRSTIQMDSPEPRQALNRLFEILNIAHPDDYRARSLSVDDIVTLTINGERTGWRCARYGWDPIEPADQPGPVPA